MQALAQIFNKIVLNAQENPYLNQATPKKYLPNLPTQKTQGIGNFKPQKILRSSPSLENDLPPPPPVQNVKILLYIKIVQSFIHLQGIVFK